jgi:hypothetical protein
MNSLLFADWRGAYWKGGRWNYCKCFQSQADEIDYVFDMMEPNDAMDERIEYIFILPFNLLAFTDNQDNDIQLDDLLDSYLFPIFYANSPKRSVNTMQRIKNDSILENEKLKLYFEAHVYCVNRKQTNTQIVTPILTGIHTCDIEYTHMHGLGLLSFNIRGIKVYEHTPEVFQMLARCSNQPFDDPEPLIDIKMNYDETQDMEGARSLSDLHNVCNCKVDDEDMVDLTRDFMMPDNILHKLIYDGIMSHAGDAQYIDQNKNVFVCNINLMTLLLTTQTEFDNIPRSVDKQVSHIFKEVLKLHCTKTYGTVRKSLLLDKDYLFFPVNHVGRGFGGQHWALYMCYKPFDNTVTEPLIYCIDSMFNIDTMTGVIPAKDHSINMLKLRYYLMNVAETYGADHPQQPVVSSSRTGVCLRTPQQPLRSNACGLYVYMFIDFFMKKTAEQKQELMKTIADSLTDKNIVVLENEFGFVNSRSICAIQKEVIGLFQKQCDTALATTATAKPPNKRFKARNEIYLSTSNI